jgi:hypothetical protein
LLGSPLSLQLRSVLFSGQDRVLPRVV